MDDNTYRLKDMNKLDPISYDEVDKIIIKYEDTRDKLTGQLIRNYGEDSLHLPEAYKMLDDIYSDLPQTKDVKRRRAILNQMKNEFTEEN